MQSDPLHFVCSSHASTRERPSVKFARGQKDTFALLPDISTMDCNGTNCHAECELRHLDDVEKVIRCRPFSGKPECSHLILCAAPERSGSTWLYNAVRLLCRDADIVCDSYWIHTLTPSKIQQRLDHLCAGVERRGGIVLIKTHEWRDDYNDWLVERFHPTIFLTHRNLVGVVKSYRRVGWAYTLPPNYVHDHLKWRKVSSLDLKYEDIVGNSTVLHVLEQLSQQVHEVSGRDVSKSIIEQIHEQLIKLDDLPGYSCRGGPNQITKVWPGHVSHETKRLQSNNTNCDRSVADDHDLKEQLLRKYAEYMKIYGYK